MNNVFHPFFFLCVTEFSFYFFYNKSKDQARIVNRNLA